MRRLVLLVALTLSLVTVAPAQAADPPPPGANDFTCRPTEAHPRPVILVHGFGATMQGNWWYQSPRIKRAGYCVFALTYGRDPRMRFWPSRPGGTISMKKSAPELGAFVDRVLDATGARKVDLVGHSEGTIMPRYYLERLGGARKVKKFVSLAPSWRGTAAFGLASVRDILEPYGLSGAFVSLYAAMCGACPESLRGSDFLNDLNADGEAIPGITHTNVVTRTDVLVQPYTSGIMRDGGTNIILQQVCPLDLSDHSALVFDPVVTQLILNALDPGDAAPVSCW
jgi:pimeloyl-ACP methyl ester carboxylesterase